MGPVHLEYQSIDLELNFPSLLHLFSLKYFTPQTKLLKKIENIPYMTTIKL